MRWEGRKQSSQVEDRRGFPGGGRGMAVGGCGTLILVLVVSWLTGVDPLALLQTVGTGGGVAPPGADVSVPAGVQPGTGDPGEDRLASFASVVLADTEETWAGIFRKQGVEYRLPTLVLFRDAVQSACGFNAAAVGPFYCPADGRLYLDLAFFDALDARVGAPGDFAQAYVIAHEVGHHVQNLLGLADRVTEAQRRARSQEEVNALSVRMELQADCLAGVWGRAAAGRGLLEPGDVEEGLGAAAAIGDDRLQRMSQGQVAPESWTHGSSEMRVRWLRRGLESGDPDQCDTFTVGGGA
jgi:predicted metalloprotease